MSLSSSGHNATILLVTPCQNIFCLSFLSFHKKTNLLSASPFSPAHFKLLHPPDGFVIFLPEPLPSFWSCAVVRAALLNLDYLPPTQLSACTSCTESCNDQPVRSGKGNRLELDPCKLPKFPPSPPVKPVLRLHKELYRL